MRLLEKKKKKENERLFLNLRSINFRLTLSYIILYSPNMKMVIC